MTYEQAERLLARQRLTEALEGVKTGPEIAEINKAVYEAYLTGKRL